MARFKVKGIFTATNMGQVLSGDIVEGEISAGDVIRLLVNGSALSFKIKSVEPVELMDNKKKIETGLVIGSFDKDVQEKLNVVTGRTVSVIRIH